MEWVNPSSNALPTGWSGGLGVLNPIDVLVETSLATTSSRDPSPRPQSSRFLDIRSSAPAPEIRVSTRASGLVLRGGPGFPSADRRPSWKYPPAEPKPGASFPVYLSNRPEPGLRTTCELPIAVPAYPPIGGTPERLYRTLAIIYVRCARLCLLG